MSMYKGTREFCLPTSKGESNLWTMLHIRNALLFELSERLLVLTVVPIQSMQLATGKRAKQWRTSWIQTYTYTCTYTSHVTWWTVTYHPKVFPTTQCHVPPYRRSNSRLIYLATSWLSSKRSSAAAQQSTASCCCCCPISEYLTKARDSVGRTVVVCIVESGMCFFGLFY